MQGLQSTDMSKGSGLVETGEMRGSRAQAWIKKSEDPPRRGGEEGAGWRKGREPVKGQGREKRGREERKKEKEKGQKEKEDGGDGP